MAPVEWTRLTGELVEEVVAVLLCREFPKAQAVRSSQGDGGIDLLVPNERGEDVYQIKKFASNLTAAQKRQITRSLDRLEETKLENGVVVNSWKLTMPLDPTNQNRKWFSQFTSIVDYPCEWRGRTYVDGLAAKYPDVIDYYLHDGADRLAGVVKGLASAMGLQPKVEGAGLLTPGQLSRYLGSVKDLLDTDPHFRYEVSIGPHRESVPDEPGLIVAVSEGVPGPNGNAVTVKVYPRFAAALDFRPIPFKLTMKAAVGSELAGQMRASMKYGTPLAAPFGSVDGSIDLPGDLGGVFEGGAIRIRAVANRQGRVIRLASIDPAGDVMASVVLDLQPPTMGLDGTGMSVRGTDRGQAIDVEFLTDLTEQTMNLRLTTRDIAGRRPSDILPALMFLKSLHSPNCLALAEELGPISGTVMELGEVGDWVHEDSLDGQIQLAQTISELQEWTPVQLVVPRADCIDSESLWLWEMAIRLFKGETAEIGQLSVGVCLHPGLAPPEGTFAFASLLEMSVRVGDLDVKVGLVVAEAPFAEVLEGSVHGHEDHFDVTVRTSNGVSAFGRIARTEEMADFA